jgi:hypothetical protein
MASIEVDKETKRTVTFAARMAGITEGELIRRWINESSSSFDKPETNEKGVRIFADYEGHRTHALYFAPARVEITDGPLRGKSFKTPSGAARAVVRHYNPGVNDNRNGWTFWQVDDVDGRRVWLQAIRPAGGDT